jgi:hypothetical protein
MATCPDCKGERRAFAHINTVDPETHGFQWVDCLRCGGAGIVTNEELVAIAKGKELRKARIAAGRSLRQEAERLGVSVVDLSRRERGKDPTPGAHTR